MTSSRKFFIYLICTAQFLVLLDFSATNVFAPEILASLGMGESQGFWLMTAFALPYGAFLLIGGRAADWFGEIKVLLVGLALVVAGNLLCASVSEAGPFLLARALQGLAAALISPASMVAIARACRDEEERAGAFSIFGAVSSLGFSAGLVVAGLVGEYSGWRYFFGGAAILTALVLLALLLWRKSSATPVATPARDFVPLLALSTLLTLAILGLSVLADEEAIGNGAFGASLFGLSCAGLYAILRREKAAGLAALRLSLGRRPALAATLVYILLGAALAPMLLMLSLYQSVVMGQDVLAVALRFLPHGLACVAFGQMLPHLMKRYGALAVAVGSLLLFSIGLLCFVGLSAGSSYLFGLFPGLILTALGIVGTFVSVLVLATGAVPDDEQGMISGLLSMGDQIGAALGLTASAFLLLLLTPGNRETTTLIPACFYLLAAFPLVAALLLLQQSRHLRAAPPLES